MISLAIVSALLMSACSSGGGSSEGSGGDVVPPAPPSSGGAGVSSPQPVVPKTTWPDLRDGDLFVRASNGAQPLQVTWRAVFLADRSTERLYWYGPDGRLLETIDIDRDQPNGNQTLSFSGGQGDYRLVVPGRSRRAYSVTVPAGLPSVFAPVKLHMALEADADLPLYWSGPVPADGLQVLLRSHEGQAAVDVEACALATDGTVTACNAIGRLTSEEGDAYETAPALDVSTLPTLGVLRVKPTRDRKLSFWIDDAPSIFAQSPNAWFVPEFPTGDVMVSLSLDSASPMPTIGSYFEFFTPPAELAALHATLGVTHAQYYAPEDVLTRNPDHDVPIIEAYQDIGVTSHQTILNDTQRDSVTADEAASISFFADYIERRAAQGLGPDSVAFIDEPNLRYGSYSAFEDYFVAQALSVRGLASGGGPVVKIAAPESSLMRNAPSMSSMQDRSGIVWAENLLTAHWDLVDIISWHAWNIFDIAALDLVADEIAAVEALNTQLAAARSAPPKALAITQTNISSGTEISPYEVDTFFAGLWWATLVSIVAEQGILDQINWFKAVDENEYGKGLTRCSPTACVQKPVADVFGFINANLFESRVSAQSDRHAVKSFAVANPAGDVHLFVVNGDFRSYRIEIMADSDVCFIEAVQLTDGDADNVIEESVLSAPALQELAPASITLFKGSRGVCP